jgi:low temperature requirement protein LtrA
VYAEFRRRFWLPPRAHGEIIEDRRVSWLELFYDLTYVVVIGRIAHRLAGDVSWRGAFHFAVVFGLVWIAWMNGTLYYELHGREDGRTRVFVFIQMLILALLAVYAGDASGADGSGFAIVYILFLAVLTWLWYSVRRRDREEYMVVTGRFLWAMLITILTIAISILVTNDGRMIIWATLVLFWVVGGVVLAWAPGMDSALPVTDSLVERYGLLVIIVLGEVVVGVVEGLSEAERNAEVIATGLFGLSIGFAYWWTYFDFVGRRRPLAVPSVRFRWLFTHLPLTMAMAAAGAAMISLIEHGGEASTPAATAWLLSGSVLVALMALIINLRTLEEGAPAPLSISLLVAGAGAMFFGWLGPRPWVLAALLVVTLLGLWFYAVMRRYQAWGGLEDRAPA